MTARTPVPAHLRPDAPQQQGPKATEPQVRFIRDLLTKKNLLASPKFFDTVNAMDQEEFNDYLAMLARNAEQLTKKQASKWIETLLNLPDKGGTAADEKQDWPDVPAGRYALMGEQNPAPNHPSPNDDDTITFYKVDRPTEGRWAGFTFLSAGKGGPHGEPEWIAIRKADRKRALLEEIARDPGSAAQMYGMELGHCGVCGRTLTDETSRQYGIGPVCRERTGW